MIKNFDISNLVVKSLCDIRHINHPAEAHSDAIAPHCALIIRKSGKSVYKSGSDSLEASSDNIIFIAKGTKYSLTVKKPGDCTVVEFDAADPCPELGSDGGICEYITTGDKSIHKLAKSLSQYFELRGPAYSSKCLSELYALITQISTVHAYNHSLAGKYGLIHESIKFIESNYSRQDLYTPALAELSGIGETYYRNIFLAVFSMPPARYIQIYRIEKAKELLLNSKSGIEDIAVAVGFANASYFCKVFKSITEMTPSEFMRKYDALG